MNEPLDVEQRVAIALRTASELRDHANAAVIAIARAHDAHDAHARSIEAPLLDARARVRQLETEAAAVHRVLTETLDLAAPGITSPFGSNEWYARTLAKVVVAQRRAVDAANAAATCTCGTPDCAALAEFRAARAALEEALS